MIELPPEFKFVVLWEKASAASQVEQFLTFGRNNLQARVIFIEDVPVAGDPDRTDVLFAVHKEDIWPFFYSRVKYAMKWLEDAMRSTPQLYPERLNLYRRY